MSENQNHSMVRLFTDGGSRNNPGQAAIGFYIVAENGERLWERAECVGVKSNNEAEYLALLAGMKKCKDFTSNVVKCYSDSELMVKQLNRLYRIKSERLLDLNGKIKFIALEFEEVIFSHVLRENPGIKHCDAMLNRALDRAGY